MKTVQTGSNIALVSHAGSVPGSGVTVIPPSPLTGTDAQALFDELQAEIDALALDDLTDVVITSPTTGDGLSFDGANWVNAPAGTGGMVPYYIAPGDTFTVPLYKQALFEMTITNDGILVVDGFLVAVS